SGFSLIELMIVVAIIGILASIAVPNFKKFQVKARQSEAKSQLTSLYTAEKAFEGEWTMFTGDFRNIGYSPEGKMRYNVGFTGEGTVPVAANGFVTSTNGGVAAGTLFNSAVACGQAGISCTREITTGFVAAVAANATCTAGAVPANAAGVRTFNATAQSTVVALGSDRDDQWSMNQAKFLCNNQAGI
ncbi:MAG: prepilin-type N-terminal cleavage/methylation domain-containing protein, partial [Proteobacteria bacterium]